MEYAFEITLKVRDYECDLQGIVNNANYQHYIEHTRHEYLLSRGVSFADLHARGIDAMVSRVEIAYKHSLRGSDRFVVRLGLRREGVKLVFVEDIYRLPDGVCCARGVVDTICLKDGKLTRGEAFDELLGKWL